MRVQPREHVARAHAVPRASHAAHATGARASTASGRARSPRRRSSREVNRLTAFSRYLHVNAAGTDYAARLVDYEGGAQQIVPRRIYESSHTYRLPLVEPDWLDEDDAAALRRLLNVYWRRESDLPERVRRAIWRAEYAAWTKWADLAIPLIVAAFESLFATRTEELTRNFKRRLPLLAEMVEVEGADADFAERLYRARSEDVHGHAVNLVAGWSDDAIADFRLALGLLRRTLRRLIENETFSAHFADKETVDRLFGYQSPPVFAGLAAT